METVTGYVTGINGNLANVSFDGAVHKNEVAYILVDKNVKPIHGNGDIATYAVLCMALNDDLNGNIQVISSYGN